MPTPATIAALSIRLTIAPTHFSVAERSTVMVGFSAINRGSEPADPAPELLELCVDGQPSVAWNLAIGNGARGPDWRSLAPGAELRMSWPLGEALFPQPGDYRLTLRSGDREIMSTLVHMYP